MVDFVELSIKRTQSVRTMEELSVEFVQQTFKRYFSKISAETEPVSNCRDTNNNLYLLIPQYL